MTTPRKAKRDHGPSRRQLLAGAGALGLLGGLRLPDLAGGVPPPPTPDDRRLVLLFLEGGNDGLNTVVPFADDAYHRARPRLALGAESVVPLDDWHGLHPALSPWQPLFDDGRLAIVNAVGYERPDRSHFVSRDIWHSGRRDPGPHPVGWVGRAVDVASADQLPPMALGVNEPPMILRGPKRTGLTVTSLDDVRLLVTGGGSTAALASLQAASRPATDANPLAEHIAGVAQDAYALSARLEELVAAVPAGSGYPDNPVGDQLRLAARLVRAPGGPTVQWTRLGGFDTHAVQPGTHASLLTQLGAATAAFLTDLARDGTDTRTLLVIYSEFGRRVAENGSAGTDHGAAAPLFALGGQLAGGIHGAPPDLVDLIDGDVRPAVDFRNVLGEIATRWMGWDAATLFDVTGPPVGLIA